MLKGCVPWPEEFARRYIEAGLWEGITVAEMVERTARRQPQKVAVVHGETRMTYDELVRSAKRVASGLANLGLQPQDRVVVQLPNGVEFVSLYLALNYIGVIPVMALRAHRHAEIRHFVRSSAAVAYFIADRVGSFDYRPMAADMVGEFPIARATSSSPANRGRIRPRTTRCRRTARPTIASSTNADPILRTCRRCCSRAERRRCRS